MTRMIASTVPPASVTAFAAASTWWPVVETSSISATRAPSRISPSTCERVPYSLRCLRTMTMGKPVSSETAESSSVAAPSGDARCVTPSGTSSRTAAATSRNSAGSARNRNLSKYTVERLPEDSTKSPCSSEAAISLSAKFSAPSALPESPAIGR